MLLSSFGTTTNIMSSSSSISTPLVLPGTGMLSSLPSSSSSMSSCSSSSQESSTSPRMTTTGEKNPVITKPKTTRKNSEKRKAKSRDAARVRRSTESEIFSEIADLLPLSKDTVEQMDKISIMKLAVCYLKTMQTVASLNQDKLRRQQLHHPQECHEQRKTSTIITASQSHFDKHSTNLERSLPSASLGDPVSLLDGKFAMLSTTTSKSFSQLPYTEFHNVLSLSSLNSFLLILTAKDGGIIFTSSDIEQVLGLKPTDVMGTSLYDYLHAYDHGELEELLNHMIPTGGCFEDNNKHHQSHQETCRNRVIRMKCVITERGKVVNIRQASFKPVRLVTNHTSNGNVLILVEELADITHVDRPFRIRSQVTWEFTMDLKFSSVDMKRQESLFGYRQDELLGKSFYNYFHPLDTHHVSSALDCLYKKGQCETVPYRFLTKGGGHVWIVSQFSLLQDSSATASSCSSSGTHIAASNLSSSCSPSIGNYHGNSGLNTPSHCQHNLAGNCTSSSSHYSGGFIISIHHIVRYVCLSAFLSGYACLPFSLDVTSVPVCLLSKLTCD